MRLSRPGAIIWGAALALLVALAAGMAWRLLGAAPLPGDSLRIGALHALSGPLAASEAPLVDAMQQAVDEINAAGGLLGRRVQLEVEDTRSDPAVAAAAAERLLDRGQVVALFGCWTTACRLAVKPVVERRHQLLFFPGAHVGFEQSPQIVYLGATPNQQLLPATDWAMHRFGGRVYWLGSHDGMPGRLPALLGDFVRLEGGRLLGARALPPGANDMNEVIAELQRLRPDVVVSTLAGDSNAAFFDALLAAGLEQLPLLSLGAAEPELRADGAGRLARHYSAWSYFESGAEPENLRYLARLRQRRGAGAHGCDPSVTAYVAVQLWAAAVREAGQARPDVISASVVQQVVPAPLGLAAMDGQTRHLWRPLRIGQVRPDGHLDEVYALPRAVRPSPWPGFRAAQYWTAAHEL